MTTTEPDISTLPSNNDWESIDILGVQIDCIGVESMLVQFGAWITDEDGGCRQVCTVNPEFVMDARRDSAFANVLRRADLRVADGIGILLAARMQGVALPSRVTGSDGIYQICERAAERGWSVFFLGAAPGVAQKTARVLQGQYPQLRVAGAYAGSPQQRDWTLIEQRLTDAQPDILLAAFGHPKQDYWIDHHRHELPSAVAMGVGGAFDFVSGMTVRAPRWMRRLGLEWLHRLMREPWRWRRMSRLPVFAALAARQAIFRQ